MESFEKLLIEHVRRFDILYKTKTRLYKHTVKREAGWLNISRKLGVKVEYCKQRWKSLRDRFVREHKRMQSGSPDTEVWEFYDQMLFLKDYVKTRTTYSTPDLLEFNQSIPDVQVKLEKADRTRSDIDDRTEDIDFIAPDSVSIPEAEFSDAGNYSLEDLSNLTEPRSKKFKLDAEGAFVNLIGDISKLVDKRQNVPPPPEETENTLFMKMIAKKLDLLPMTTQGALQIQILTLVNHAVTKNVKEN